MAKRAGKKGGFTRAEIINSLMENKVKLHPSLIEEFGEIFRFHPKTRGNPFDIFSEFTDEALKVAYDCFVKHELDSRGRFLEYRFAQWLTKYNKEIVELDIDKKIPDIGEIDVVGYGKDKRIITIAECKSRGMKAKAEDLDKWITNVKLIIENQKRKYDERYLSEAFFVNLSGYTDEALSRFVKRPDVTSTGKLKVGWGGLEKIDIGLCEEREGIIKKVFPKG